MRYPISVQTFETIIEGGYVYVDKTDLVYDLAQEHVCFLSRPRRFGKSLLLSTLEAYFLGRKELFTGLKMEALENDWLTYPVFRLDFADGNYAKAGELEKTLSWYMDQWEEQYDIPTNRDIPSEKRFRIILDTAVKRTGRKAVVLIDEYDKPLLDVIGEEQENINRNILKGFYGTFKAADASLRFVLLTGVTKFSQISVFSGFNQPNDISMNSKFDALCGITEEELYSVFAEPIRQMAISLKYSEDKMKAILKKKYDGYHFSKALLDVYNPFSLINAFNSMDIQDYWYRSGTPTYLAKLLEDHEVNMKELLSQPYEPRYFVDYRADVENPLAMLYQSGYLTIKDYDEQDWVYTLDYPNDEVCNGFVTLTAKGYFKKPEDEAAHWILNLARMLRRGALDEVRDAFTAFLASISYEANKNERAKDFESHFSYTFYLIFRMLSCYTILIEKENSKGRADVIIECDNGIYIFEFKLDKSAQEALDQIEKQQYALPYLTDPRPVHKIGVNISSASRTVDDWLEA